MQPETVAMTEALVSREEDALTWQVSDDETHLCRVCSSYTDQGFLSTIFNDEYEPSFLCRLCGNGLACAFAAANGLRLVEDDLCPSS